MHKSCTTIASRHGAGLPLRAAIVAGCAIFLSGCYNNDRPVTGVPAAPADYRMRHPITIREGERTFEILVGSTRGTLTADQRAQVTAFAQGWKHDATGGVIIDVPVGSGNAHAAADALPEVRSLVAASGVPPQAIVIRKYQPAERVLATIRITYPKIAAQAGPCGLWPEDIGPTMHRDYFENQPYWNLGCSIQHNLAVMVDNPADLVQPRGETPPYQMRRTAVVDKYRQGQSTATQYANPTAGRITDVGQ